MLVETAVVVIILVETKLNRGNHVSVIGKYFVQTHLCVLVKRCSDFGSTSWQEIRSRHEEGCEYIRLPKGDNIEEDML